MLVEPQKRLPCAAQFRHFVDDQADCFLHPAIRILLQPVAGLYDPDRRSHDQFAAFSLLVTGG